MTPLARPDGSSAAAAPAEENVAVALLAQAGVSVDELPPLDRMALEQLSVEEAHVLAKIAARFVDGSGDDLREIEGNRNF